MSLNRPETRTSRAWDWPRSGIVSEIRSQGQEWTGIKTAALCEDEGLRVKSQLCHANSNIQPLHVCPWLCVEHSQRALGHISSEESLIIDSSDTLQRVIFSLSLTEECHCVSGIPQMRGGLFFLNGAKFVQASSGPHAVCLATEGGIFHSVPSPERAAFLPVLFYRHRWKWVTAVRVTVFLSGKYWCICETMLICTLYWQFFPRGAYLGQDGAPIYPRAANFLSAPPQLWHKSTDLHKQADNAAVKMSKRFFFFLWRQIVVCRYHAGINKSQAQINCGFFRPLIDSDHSLSMPLINSTVSPLWRNRRVDRLALPSWLLVPPRRAKQSVWEKVVTVCADNMLQSFFKVNKVFYKWHITVPQG